MSIEKAVLDRAVAFRAACTALTVALREWRAAKGSPRQVTAAAAVKTAEEIKTAAYNDLLQSTELYERRFHK